MCPYDYDLFVIGGGSGGVRAARLAGQLNKKVALAEGYRLGGTCVVRGCIPKKLMYYASEYSHLIKESRDFGWSVDDPEFSFEKFSLVQKKEVSRLEKLYRQGLENNNVEIYFEYAKLLDAHRICLSSSGKIISAKEIILAPGGSPFLPNIKGIENAITSNEVLALEKLPQSMIIVGGGYISLEFACILNNLGVDITLISRTSSIAKKFDNELASILQETIFKKGIKLHLSTEVTKIEKKKSAGSAQEYDIHLSTGKILKTESIFYATGRRAATKNLGLKEANIECDEKGQILTNKYKQTNQKHIYAIGDAANSNHLTPVAIHEAMCVIQTLYHNNPTAPDYENIATAIFSQPELGTVGDTEVEAVKKFKNIDVYKTKFKPLKSAFAKTKDEIFMKILVDKKTDLVKGVHLIGPQASEMIQILAIALKGKLTKKDFDNTMAVHPTAAEELVTLYKPSYTYIDGKKIKDLNS